MFITLTIPNRLAQSVFKTKMITLSYDLLLCVTRYLSYTDVVTLLRVNRALSKLYISEHFWKHKMMEEYPQYCSSSSAVPQQLEANSYHLSYKYLSLLPSFSGNYRSSNPFIFEFDIEGMTTPGSDGMKHLTFIYPLPRHACRAIDAGNKVFEVVPDIIIWRPTRTFNMCISTRSTLLGNLPMVGQNLPCLKSRVAEEAEINIGFVGQRMKYTFDTIHLPALLQQIQAAGYCYTKVCFPNITINPRHVRDHPEFFNIHAPNELRRRLMQNRTESWTRFASFLSTRRGK